MLSTDEDGILQDEMLQFPNLINLHDLDYTFEVMVEVYTLQNTKETIDHNTKYHIRKVSLHIPNVKVSALQS